MSQTAGPGGHSQTRGGLPHGPQQGPAARECGPDHTSTHPFPTPQSNPSYALPLSQVPAAMNPSSRTKAGELEPGRPGHFRQECPFIRGGWNSSMWRCIMMRHVTIWHRLININALLQHWIKKHATGTLTRAA